MIKINKAQWKTYKFGKVVSNISERAEPKETNLDIYVGLEHLDADCIHIKRKGHPSDVKGTKLRVYPGDIIFGKRRAYQRKAAVVDFDGICSAHAMVVRANPEVILPELLPYFMHSDAFMHRAVDVSEGSLSPTIKWKILAEQPFKLPPIEEQKPIADLLLSVDNAMEKWTFVLGGLDLMQQTILKEMLLSRKIIYKKVSDFGTVVTGKTPPTGNKELWGGNIPFVTPSDMQEAKKFIDRTERYVTDAAIKKGKVIPAGSLLVVCIASIGKLSFNTKDCITNQQINVVISNDKNNLEYLYYILTGKPAILKRVAGHSVVPIINKSLFEEVKIPYSENSQEREEIVKKFSDIDQKKTEIFGHIIKTKAIYKQIINQIFG